jgi:MFS family permease
MLHGICYDFFFVTGQIYVDKQAPRRIRGQAQGFLVLVTQGVGMLIGAQVISRVVRAYTKFDAANVEVGKDWQTIWAIPSVLAAVILLIFLVAFRNGKENGTGA